MRVAIVNDMPMAIEGLRRAVLADNKHQIAWTAWDGEEAVERCAKDVPDLILMDLIMPKMNGIEATEKIMQSTPCPILIVTASVDQNSSMVFEAMGKGALDAVNTPLFVETDKADDKETLLQKIAMIGILTQPARKSCHVVGSIHPNLVLSNEHLVAIGSSSGGPKALAQLLGGLPVDFPAAVVIVQHVDEQFSQALAEWLDNQSPLPVRIAKHGDKPSKGEILLAGTNNHLVLSENGELHYQEEPRESHYRPSVDVFWNSLHKNWPGNLTAILLTGMGKDGARAMLELRKKGAYTIAQDEKSSTVFGMPKAAIELGAAINVYPIEDIAGVLCVKQKKQLHN